MEVSEAVKKYFKRSVPESFTIKYFIDVEIIHGLTSTAGECTVGGRARGHDSGTVAAWRAHRVLAVRTGL